MRRHIIHYVWLVAILCVTPLFGVLYLELPVAPYLEFPPTTKYVSPAPFQWAVFLLLLLFIAAVCFPFLYRLITKKPHQEKKTKVTCHFPWWGWLGGTVVLSFWVLAWNRYSFFEPLQRYTFFPLWAGYILAVNGLSYRRKGRCLLRTNPRFFLKLFPASALFWWYFEYLNRFVQNWHYFLGDENISATEYIIHATICFSTVLPAVLSTNELLETLPRLTKAFTDWRSVAFSNRKGIGWLLLAGSAFSLAALAVLTDYLFPLVWIAPLMVIAGIQLATGRPTIFIDVEKGNWQGIVLPALAALICGFFWEMWNWKSLAHWEYSIPFVHRFQIFAMPLLGYAGYLPFGLECAAVAALIRPPARYQVRPSAETLHAPRDCR